MPTWLLRVLTKDWDLDPANCTFYATIIYNKGVSEEGVNEVLASHPRASISSVKGDSGKDGIGRRVSKTSKIRVGKRKLAKLNKIGMSIGTCIDVPDWLMLPG